MRETSASEPLAKHRKRIQMTSKPGPLPSSGKSMAETYVLAMRCPVLRRRDSHSGFCTELENLDGDGKGKGTSGQNREAEGSDGQTGGGLFGGRDEGGQRPWSEASRSSPFRLGQPATGGARYSTEGGSLQAVARAG